VAVLQVNQKTYFDSNPNHKFFFVEDMSFQIVYKNQVTAVKASSLAQKRQWLSQIQHYSSLQQYNQ
jgi:hypothetical protein